MSTFRLFEEIEVWKRGRVLANDLYVITKRADFASDYSLRNQVNAAVGSIMHNIAEGLERGGNKEFLQFLYISKGSTGEVRSQHYLDRSNARRPNCSAEKKRAQRPKVYLSF